MHTTRSEVCPTSGEELAAALKSASDAHESVLIRGAGTKLDWCRPAGPIDVVVDTRGLSRLIEHQHGDLTATVEAGATLRELNVVLARRGQCLPLDPPFSDGATIGGILACNDSGPLRHRFGTPRDLVIGVSLATTDGVVAKAGGRVVKNVAGYDLSRLITGSFGSLAAIVSATFKLSPLPAASKTFVVDVAQTDAGAASHAGAVECIVREVMASQLEPISFEIDSDQSATASGATVLLRFCSVPAVVDAQIAAAMALPAFKQSHAAVLDGDAERLRWRQHAQDVWNTRAAIVRASWLPASIGGVITGLGEVAAAAGCRTIRLVGRAAIGAGLVAIEGDDQSQARAIGALRASPDVGNVVVVRASATLKTLVDVWGPAGDRQHLFEAMKRAFDPNGVLNAGRGPL